VRASKLAVPREERLENDTPEGLITPYQSWMTPYGRL
jgi:hypothetical protein